LTRPPFTIPPEHLKAKGSRYEPYFPTKYAIFAGAGSMIGLPVIGIIWLMLDWLYW
jgi:hypothetical protein